MAKRSPILGYNHNIRHRGLVFHIQTEDSGVDNPHIFTHLFRGGVILSTRKLNYDPESSEDTVKGLMQAQHKAVMKGLKHGEFDDKIDAYLGNEPGLEPRAPETEGQEANLSVTNAEHELGRKKRAGDRGDVSAAFDAIAEQSAAAQAPRAGEYSQHRKNNRRRSEPIHDLPTAPISRQPPPKTTPPPRPAGRRPSRPSSGGVVVSRPAVIVGAPPKVVGQPAKGAVRAAPRARKAREEADGIFGQDLISEKSLDEVILAYLSEDGSDD